MAKYKRPSDSYPTGTKVKFHSGNFAGLEGTVLSVIDRSTDPNAIHGFKIVFSLSDGTTGAAYKIEHLTKI